MPFTTIAAACASVCPADAEVHCECRLIDRVDDNAAVVLRTIPDAPDVRYYGLAIRDGDGWELHLMLTPFEVSGGSYGASNCCSSRAIEPPHWSAGRIDGVVALRASQTWVRFSKPTWEPFEDAPRAMTQVLLCRDSQCTEIHLPSCVDSVFAIDGDDVRTACPGVPWSQQTTLLTASP